MPDLDQNGGGPLTPDGEGGFACRVTVKNQRGLHARAAAKFVKLAAHYDADVQVTKGGQTVSGSSILGLMMLAAGTGTHLDLVATGPQAKEALEALRAMIDAKFEED